MTPEPQPQLEAELSSADTRMLSPRAGLLLFLIVLGFVLGSIEGVRWLFRVDPPDPMNGFTIADADVPLDEIERAGTVGLLRPLVDPGSMPAAEAEALKMRSGNPIFLVSSDRVAIVEVNGETRGYPLRVLVFHEVVNDTVGGVPIAIVHHPVSGMVVAFERTVAEEELTFGPSGLFLDSSLLIFDRPPGNDIARQAESSLWSPLIGTCLGGPRLGERLTRLPVAVTNWADFKASVEDPQVVRPHPDYVKSYRKDLYNQYEGMGIPRFRFDPRPPEPTDGGRPLFTRMLVVAAGSPVEVRAFALEEIVAAHPEGVLATKVGGEEIELRVVDRERAVVRPSARAGSEILWSLETYWFVWFASRERILEAAR